MKKNLFIGLLLASLTFGAQAAFVSDTVNTNTGASLLLTNAQSVTKMYFYSTNAVAASTIRLFDSASLSITYTNGAYTNVVSYLTNLVTEYVDTQGYTNSMTNSVLAFDKKAGAAATNTLPVKAMFILPVNQTLVITDPYTFSRGLVMSNSVAGVTVVVEYHK